MFLPHGTVRFIDSFFLYLIDLHEKKVRGDVQLIEMAEDLIVRLAIQ